MRSALLLSVLAGLMLVSSSLPSAQAQESPTLTAMRDELTRSMSTLRLTGEPAPYYIDYTVEDTSTLRTTSRLGALLDDTVSRVRTLEVDVRVGDYAFDSSRFVVQNRPGLGGGGGAVFAALDDDYDVMRRQIWLATDEAYKRAVGVFARKKAAFQNRASAEAFPDLSQEAPVDTVETTAIAAADRATWVERTRQLSAVFDAKATIASSDVAASEVRGTRYYVNSEGMTAIVPLHLAQLRVIAEAQADDGMTVRDGFSLVENRLEDLPPMAALTARMREVADRLVIQRTAPVGEEFTGPVLIDGAAGAEFIAQTLAPLMLARRLPDGENPRFAQQQGQGTPFLKRIGLRVLSDAFSVSDTPSLTQYQGRPVPGAYLVDGEGVRAKDVTLVDKGRLMTLLTGRVPQKNLPHSNGHGRAGLQPGVFQVQSALAVPASELKGKYLELLKAQDTPFGYIVRSIANPNDIPVDGGPGGPVILQAFKVTPDGKEQAVRGLRFGLVASAAFRDLVEASQERMLYSYRASSTDAVSIISPGLLFEELEIQKISDVVQKPPIVASPIRD